MSVTSLLDGKTVLIVDDEPDVVDTLKDLLPTCVIYEAFNFSDASEMLDSIRFDIAILDIMGVDGYKLLKIADGKNILPVMLTAYALTPEDVARSYKEGAAYFIPKEEMMHISSFLEDVLAEREKGGNTWNTWMTRMADFCKRKFQPDWKKKDRIFWDKFPFY